MKLPHTTHVTPGSIRECFSCTVCLPGRELEEINNADQVKQLLQEEKEKVTELKKKTYDFL